MERHELTPLLEALLFASDQPLTVNAMVKAVDDERAQAAEVRAALEALVETYDFQERGFRLVRLGSGYQVVTRERYAPWVEAMVSGKRKARLSRAALETAAVIAYKQPITRLDIERIRGVDAGAVLNTLLERSLIMIKGRDPGPGRPLLYGTTQEFLNHFGLSRLTDLPRLDEIAALAKAEAPPAWDDTERARFEKFGVDAESVPYPEGPEAAAGDGAAALDEEAEREADRAEFREVVSALAAEEDPPGVDEGDAPWELSPEEPRSVGDDEVPAGPDDDAPAEPDDDEEGGAGRERDGGQDEAAEGFRPEA